MCLQCLNFAIAATNATTTTATTIATTATNQWNQYCLARDFDDGEDTTTNATATDYDTFEMRNMSEEAFDYLMSMKKASYNLLQLSFLPISLDWNNYYSNDLRST